MTIKELKRLVDQLYYQLDKDGRELPVHLKLWPGAEGDVRRCGISQIRISGIIDKSLQIVPKMPVISSKDMQKLLEAHSMSKQVGWVERSDQPTWIYDSTTMQIDSVAMREALDRIARYVREISLGDVNPFGDTTRVRRNTDGDEYNF